MAPLIAVISLERRIKMVDSLNVDIWSWYVTAQPFPVCFRNVCENRDGEYTFYYKLKITFINYYLLDGRNTYFIYETLLIL
jgi:hypothetical protein